MPTIEFSLKDLSNLIGKSLTIEELNNLLDYSKSELESYNKSKNLVKVKLDDTNLPYLWSVEGLARLFAGVLGKERGVPKFKLNATNNKIVVDKNLADIRPYIGAFIAKNCRLNNYVINQIIQLQEKLCDNYGKKREKIAIGVYKHKKIIFPVYYKAVAPEAKFVPLGLNK